MKVLRKDMILENGILGPTISEQNILIEAASHQLMVGMRYVFQD